VHFSELAMFSGPELLPYLLGSDVPNLLKNSFRHERNCFSFEHSLFLEVNGKIAGVAQAYSCRQKKDEQVHTGEIIGKYLDPASFTEIPDSAKMGAILAQMTDTDYYFSNCAVYPELRSLGYGSKLFEAVEEEAKRAGCGTIVLDVETDNTEAVKLYQRLGYKIERRSPVVEAKIKIFEFFKMSRELE